MTAKHLKITTNILGDDILEYGLIAKRIDKDNLIYLLNQLIYKNRVFICG